MMPLLRARFGLKTPVPRGAYIVGGALFMLLKLAIERPIFMHWLSRELTPVAFLSPFFADRAELLRDAPDAT